MANRHPNATPPHQIGSTHGIIVSMPPKVNHLDAGNRPLSHQPRPQISNRIPHPYTNTLLERLSDNPRARMGPSCDSTRTHSSKSKRQTATARQLIQCLSWTPSNHQEEEEEKEGQLVAQPSSQDEDRSQEKDSDWKERFLQGWPKSPIPKDMPWNEELCIGSYIRVDPGQEICMHLWATRQPILRLLASYHDSFTQVPISIL